jgi:hypothetical protein
MRAGADGVERRERWATADVPFTFIGVPFRREAAASSAGSVSFSFIHTNVMPLSGIFRFPLGRIMR